MSAFIILFFHEHLPTAYSQDILPTNANDRFWISFGQGITFRDRFIGPSTCAALSYAKHGEILSIRFVSAKNLNLLVGENSPYTTPVRTINEAGILYGFTKKDQHVLFSASAGPGCVQAINEGRSEGERRLAVGLSLEAQAFFTLASFCGVGVYSFANVSHESSFIGFSLSVQIGKL